MLRGFVGIFMRCHGMFGWLLRPGVFRSLVRMSPLGRMRGSGCSLVGVPLRNFRMRDLG